MKVLNLPSYPFQLKSEAEVTYIFDEVRRKWLQLTPEEWVRQHFIMYLNALGYPTGLFAIEKKVLLNGMTRRVDLLVYDTAQKPFLLVECKAPEIAVDQKTLDQAVRYHSVVKVPFIILTNGLSHFCFQMNPDGKVEFVNKIPDFPSA